MLTFLYFLLAIRAFTNISFLSLSYLSCTLRSTPISTLPSRANHLQSTIQDLIQIKPHDFGKPSAQAIKDAINSKYSNKIVPGVGLCVALWDLVSAT